MVFSFPSIPSDHPTLFTEVPRETVWKIAEGILVHGFLVAQNGKRELLCPGLPTRGDPTWSLSGVFRQSQKENTPKFAKKVLKALFS
jgi:hypothetical protein